MSCELIEEISSLIDGELTADRARLLERHVTQCDDCQKARADFLNLRNQITAFNPALDPAGASQRLDQILGTGYVPQSIPARATRSLWPISWLRPSPAFATLAVLLIAGVVGLVVYRSHYRESATPVPDGTMAKQANKSSNSGADASGATQLASVSNNNHAIKPGGKGSKTKTRPRVETPKPRTTFPELTSPYGRQVIATNSADNEGGRMRAADAETLTARHLEQSELLLRAFRNVRAAHAGLRAEVAYERQRAQKLVYQNILLRREADASGDVQVSTLLDSLEPILLDIANLPDQPHDEDVKAIKERVERKNLVALLQVNSALARANE